MLENLEVALKRGFMLLADGNFEKADDFFEQALNIDPENVEAYKGKLLAELELKSELELENHNEPFIYSDNYKKLLSFADNDTKVKFENYNNEIIYKNAVAKMNSATTAFDYEAASKIFANINAYKDSNKLSNICDNSAIYLKAIDFEKDDTVFSLKQAVIEFEKIIGFKDTSEKIKKCNGRIIALEQISEQKRIEDEKEQQENIRKTQKRDALRKKIFIISTPIFIFSLVTFLLVQYVFIPSSKYNNAIKFYNNGDFDKAIEFFYELNDYKDSEQQIKKCNDAKVEKQYTDAIDFLENKEYKKAVNIFENLGDYKDSKEKYKESNYNLAIEYLNENNKQLAAITFYKANGFKDAENRSLSLWQTINTPKTITINQFIATFAITNNNEILKYGFGSSAELNIPKISDAKSICCDFDRVIILDSKGSIHKFGDDIKEGIEKEYWDEYIDEDYSNWTNLIDIDCSDTNTIGLKDDGTVLMNGRNNKNQINAQKWNNIISVEAENSCLFGVQKNGKVCFVGDPTDGEGNVSEWEGIVKLSCGVFHTVGLRADGTCVATGNNDNGQLNVEDWSNVISIATSNVHTVALLNDGTVVSTNKDSEVNQWTDIIAIFAGGGKTNTTIGLKADGTILIDGLGSEDWKNIKTK